MPDSGPVVGELFEVVRPVLGSTARVLLRTTVGSLLLGALVLLLEAWLVVDRPLQGVALLVPGVVLLGALTGLLAVKNSVLRGVMAAMQQLGLGARAVKLVFDRLVDSRVAKVAQRVPFREAEAKVRAVVDGVLAERSAKRGVRAWLARALTTVAMERVQAVTLARFRRDEAEHGGVDLEKVRDELGATIDGLIAGHVGAQINRLTVLVFAGYVGATALLAYGVSVLPT